MLEISLRHHAVAAAGRIAAELQVFLEQLLGGAADAHVRAVAVEDVVAVERDPAAASCGGALPPPVPPPPPRRHPDDDRGHACVSCSCCCRQLSHLRAISRGRHTHGASRERPGDGPLGLASIHRRWFWRASRPAMAIPAGTAEVGQAAGDPPRRGDPCHGCKLDRPCRRAKRFFHTAVRVRTIVSATVRTIARGVPAKSGRVVAARPRAAASAATAAA